MKIANRICTLFNINIPLVQAGMVWCSGWTLASAVSNSEGLGLLGAGSMLPNTLEEHIKKTRSATNKPFGVNLPLLYPHTEQHIKTIIQENVEIVFTSAGNPSSYTRKLKDQGIKVVHVVSSLKFAKKACDAGVDAIVAEGFEAGGHNGKDETTTMCLLQLLKREIEIPVIAAGGIYSGSSMLAAFALGAEGVQIGSRFAACVESSAHDNFKQKVFDAKEGDTDLLLKSLTPVRMLKNEFYKKLKELELQGASESDLKTMLGKGRSRKGIMEGDMLEGELEIGQVSALIEKKQTAGEIVNEIYKEFLERKDHLCML